MRTPRWLATTATMCGIAWALSVLGSDAAELRAAVASPQTLVDTAGPDALVLVVASATAWACWAWGALGLLLTAASALPGWAGRSAGSLLPGLLPAAARRAAALAIGVGLTATAPLALPSGPPPVALTTMADHRPTQPATVLEDGSRSDERVRFDWPSAPPTAPTPSTVPAPSTVPSPSTLPTPSAAPPSGPDWPTAPGHVVLRGDCLWDIARDHLSRDRAGQSVSDADVATAVHAWWQANETVIGPDPDRLLPGQVLRPPR